MTDQPEVTPLSDEEEATLRAERPHPRLPLHKGRTVLLINRLLATIDQLRLESEHSDAMRRARDILAVATDDDVLAALRDTDQTRTELIVAEERCEFLRTQVADLTTAGDQLRAKVAELEARTLDDEAINALATKFAHKDPPDATWFAEKICEEIARRKGAK